MIGLKFKILAPLFLLILSLIFVYSPTILAFNLFGTPCSRGSAQANSAVCTQADKGNRSDKNNNVILDTIRTAANIVASVTGVAAVIMIIVGGFSYVTSAGNSEQVANARRRIINSAIGLVVIALAWTITTFVLNNVIG
jgi:hypothetical protein